MAEEEVLAEAMAAAGPAAVAGRAADGAGCTFGILYRAAGRSLMSCTSHALLVRRTGEDADISPLALTPTLTLRAAVGPLSIRAAADTLTPLSLTLNTLTSEREGRRGESTRFLLGDDCPEGIDVKRSPETSPETSCVLSDGCNSSNRNIGRWSDDMVDDGTDAAGSADTDLCNEE